MAVTEADVEVVGLMLDRICDLAERANARQVESRTAHGLIDRVLMDQGFRQHGDRELIQQLCALRGKAADDSKAEGHGPRQAGGAVRLFRIDAGAIYWVVAGSPDQAAIFVMELDEWTTGDTIADVRELSLRDAETLTFRLEGHASCTMAFAFDLVRSMGGAGVLACSEWP